MTRLPRSIDELRGLRAARWVRESTRGQYDNYGPDAQRDQQDRAIAGHGLADTGLAWSVAHSGRTVDRTPEWAEMVAAAGVEYDVLVVGYVSRFSRSAETHYAVRRTMHDRGAVVLFADERILTSDDDAWEAFHREIGEAESYSRRLGRNIRNGYAAKFRRLADPGGNAPLGFRRRTEKPHVLEVDPESIGQVVDLFARYAGGTVSLRQLSAETGLLIGQLAELLRNRIYNGWVMRHGEPAPAAWRMDPPVSDELWERVVAIRERRRHVGGRRSPGRVDVLRGLIACSCGVEIWANGTDRHGRTRRAHPFDRPCDAWGGQATYPSVTWEGPIGDQVAGIRVDDRTLAAVVAAVSSPEPAPVPADAWRLERRRRDLALEHAAGRMGDDEYLAAAAALREQAPAQPTLGTVPAELAVAYLRQLKDRWGDATPATKAELVAAIYDRIVVQGPEFVGVTLTPAAYAHGLAIAMPERVRSELVSPEGLGQTRSLRIPIVGRSAWLRSAKTA